MPIPIVTADKKNLLLLVQTACYEIGIPAPQSIFGNTDDQVLQLLALANREGLEFYSAAHRRGGWQALQVEYSFTTSNGVSQYSLPSDLAYFLEKTYWDGSFRWQLLGPLDAQEKNVIKYGISPVGPRRRFYILGNYMVLNPTPTTTGDIIYYDYYSSAWCQSSTGTLRKAWAADTDYYNLDDEAFIQGLKWRFLRAKGLDYSEERQSYELLKQRLMSRDGGSRDLPLNATSGRVRLLNMDNVPDTGFGA